ncbi:hypothetical protein FEM03_13570 [Phragmitibacter flavus]|uniref:Wadjet protein JetD C-terminal domain-containing protein n=1 Tax=Phragmitibacter flavus TaxID=2576071 RepID=A0A5R8KD26_9BACT|nr:Wadjet anti-phage system protein JetD domain-containing protein [Phragmitibacter flavus]TLD70212.1 hypothetical protein FEM03_13570 [Phragmitibacter flavus]
MALNTSILQTLARLYAASQAGRTGQSTTDYLCDYLALLKAAQATDGDALVQAKTDLLDAEQISQGALKLDRHPRDAQLIHRVRLHAQLGEPWLFNRLQQTSPTTHRQNLASQFLTAAQNAVPTHWQTRWINWCQQLANAALTGQSIAPLSKNKDDLPLNQEILLTLQALLAWPGESLRRFASCVICGNSKRLEELSSKLNTALTQLHGAPFTLEQLGIRENPRSVLIHGPLQLHLPNGILDATLLQGPIRLSATDLQNATTLQTPALRCLTVENETTFHELAKLQSNTLLIQTSYPGSAVITLFKLLPPNLPCWHFGDTDPSGFDILRDLRQRTQREIQPLHMQFRDHPASNPLTPDECSQLTRLAADPLMADLHHEIQAQLQANRKGSFEQESLGWPQPQWPFY